MVRADLFQTRMKNLKILKTVPGSPDGIRVEWFVEDEIREVPDGLAEIFLKEGWAVEVPDEDAGEGSSEEHVAKAESGPQSKKDRGRKTAKSS